MDGISGAAAVVGLVQVVTQVTTALSRYVSRVKEAESSRAKLLDQIRLMSSAEEAIEKVVQNSSCSLRAPELQALVDEWFKVDGPLNKCKTELQELSSWLEGRAENKYKRWTKKIGWPAKEDKIQATIRTFEGYMPYFYGILSLETFNIVESVAERYKNTEFSTAKSELLRWLNGFDCTNKHESTLQQRQQTTGDWLFREQLYDDWRKGSTRFIWLHGKAGAGKSVLASAVIDDLSNGLEDNETLAYFYCDFRHNRCTSGMEVLRSVTKQLLWKSTKDWLPLFSDLTTRREQGAEPPTGLGTLLELLQRAAQLHDRPIIVVDALDECEDLSNLLDELKKLANGHCRLFVTSRTLYTINMAFTDLSTIPLDNRVDEMGCDMHHHIKTELESRPRLEVLTRDLKDEIETVLMEKAGGMFRWVQCQLDRLNNCYSLGDVREVLDTLPTTLHGTYEQMLRAIDKKPFGPRIARRALTWLVMAVVPLTISQLAEVLAISCDKPAWDYVSAPMHEMDILDILGSLVTVNNCRITLSHYSVKEYLTSDTIVNSTYFVDRPNASLEVTTVSIFSLILFGDGSRTTVEDSQDALCSYATDFGLECLTDCHPDHNESLVKHLLALQDRISLHRHIYQRCWWLSRSVLVMPQPALYIIIRFGNLDLLQYYLDSHQVRATEEDNPLAFAVLFSDVPCVQLLLDKGLDINHQGPVQSYGRINKMTPLTAATQNYIPKNQERLVKLLLENGCFVSKDAIHSILSYDFGCLCKPAVVRVLLEHGADPQGLTTEGRSCLHLALDRRAFSDERFEIVCMLVAAGCDPMAPDIWGLSPLDLAIKQLSLEFVLWLVQHGCRLPSAALLYACSNISLPWHATKLPSMLQFLVRSSADPSAQDAHGRNALHLFSGHTHLFDDDSLEGVLQLLVDHGCDINGRTDAGETPLHLAVASPPFELRTLDLFLTQGAELPVDIVNSAVQAFGHYPMPSHDEHIMAMLTSLVKKLGASCRAWTTSGDNALHCLFKCDIMPERLKYIPEVVLLLVENGCDVQAFNSLGETPLQIAIERGYFSIAQSTLAQITKPYLINDTEPYYGNSDGNGILHRLCQCGWDDQFMDKVKLLREAGYDLARDINRPNNKGLTPLCIAITNRGHDPGIVSHLLELGASFCHVNPLYLDNVEWAANLSWYDDVINVHGHHVSRSHITCDDVTRVYHLLQVAHQGRLSSTFTRRVLDMAEYWACMKVTRNNVQCSITSGQELVALATLPREAECWIPRRLVFACKAGDFEPRTGFDHTCVRVHVRRTGAVFTVPVSLGVICNSSDPPMTVFRVWDEFTPAIQENGRQRLMVGDLLPGETLSIEFFLISSEYFTLEFFQVEMYYTMKPLTPSTSGNLRTQLDQES